MIEIDEFLFPRRVVAAPGAAGRLGSLLTGDRVPLGAVMVVADAVVHDLGLDRAAVGSLEDSGYDVVVFAEIEGEPDDLVLKRAIAAARAAQAVAFVGIGGGSALDVTKLVAHAVGGDVEPDDLRGPIAPIANFPFLALVPTTVGTGAEATRVAMFAVDGAKRAVLSAQFVPDLAVLDADLVAGLPATVVASTALDALSHALESAMSTTSNDLTRQFSVRASQIIFDRLRPALGGDREARGDLLYASFLAGVSLNAGVVLGHSLSYVLAARHGLAHGVGCSLALPYCLAYNQTMGEERGAELAAEVLQDETADLRLLATRVAELSADAGLPTDLLGLGSTPEESEQIASRVVADYPRPTNPVPLETGRLTTLITHLRTGDLAGAWTAMGATP
ncbi:iron-containing alcohol dehydrogenase [Nocardioides sp. IC4_145]|uniref:iron-containing alcohol dehydrogenase family protein n=1 Tax=Nocardioides sp. IC4_145 TaxID=2714037 RepID=UPI00140A5DF2|nr:iron-containing alcohol dehydrogenase [Nocardioides sp. IC4_145]NHC21891.1 iron-containing alcohol dehydrogenase [Nocardioides sp. IC4_145]